MRQFFANLLQSFAKSINPNTKRKSWHSPTFTHTNTRKPNPIDLLDLIQGTVYACASMNSSACAFHSPHLYKKTGKTNAFTEIFNHPILTLFKQVNPVHNANDLWELTTFDQEIFGNAYWLIDEDPISGIPINIWPLPAYKIRPVRNPDSSAPVDWYEIRKNGSVEQINPSKIIHFRYPDPRDPYGVGLSPLQACKDSAFLQSLILATKQSIWENHAMPGVILTPTEPMHEEDRARLEILWNQRFKYSGNGNVLVTESGMKVQSVTPNLTDANSLIESNATKDDIANAFGIPLSFLTKDTNLANLQAAERQHWTKTIRPKLKRRDQKLNEQLIPRYDPTGKLFLDTPEPLPWLQ